MFFIYLSTQYVVLLVYIFILFYKETFTIYVDKMRGIGGLPNVYEMPTEGVGGSYIVNVDMKFLCRIWSKSAKYLITYTQFFL